MDLNNPEKSAKDFKAVVERVARLEEGRSADGKKIVTLEARVKVLEEGKK